MEKKLLENSDLPEQKDPVGQRDSRNVNLSRGCMVCFILAAFFAALHFREGLFWATFSSAAMSAAALFTVFMISKPGWRSRCCVLLAIVSGAAVIQYNVIILRQHTDARLLKVETASGEATEEEWKEKLDRLSLQTVNALVSAIDAKDHYTGGHSSRVAQYSREIALRLGMSEQEADELYAAALLHDIGKIGIPDGIISKTAALTDEEYDLIKRHTIIGAQILGNMEEMPLAATVARYHHERYDGKGYPEGLAGEDIPFEARIVAVADSYDAMTSSRSYRECLPQDVVREEFVKNRGSQFDARIADCMIEIIDEDTEYLLHE